ncbi:hypothetical protein [Paracidobacterium acidisoli]|uniref:Uncharacterized protein n=1 Tax=Paracidobacterium acidisoli TaxID=2303751 RepID=A0A372INM6_9BACT|nr:hypothetical protein [Paracidobacterium acidisoli]MBT9332024.1 hypothetical protein [Paracidobacterium acidisoli]
MSKLKIEMGASKVKRAPLKTTIDGDVSDDLGLMCEWSDNDLSYIVNRLLRHSIAEIEDFQKYKADRLASSRPDNNGVKHASESARKVLPSAGAMSPQPEKGVIA